MPVNEHPLLVCDTREELAVLLGVSVNTLQYLAFSKRRKYKTFTLPKKNGGIRTIDAPMEALLTVQRKLAKLLSEIYSPPTYVQGFVEGGSILNNSSLHLNKRLVLNIDLSDFFP